MKLIIEVESEKADFLMELLSNFDFVKTETLEEEKPPNLLEDLKQAVKEVNLIK